MPSAKKPPFLVACFGEVLWDVLPQGMFLGGAPINVAYHLSRLGVPAVPISAVGRDFLGDEALQRITAWPAATRFISRHRRRATGTVRATLDPRGVATYRIARRVAWDQIEVSAALRRLPAPRVLVFGSLALREPGNRIAFTQLAQAWPTTLRVLDLNLRQPFDRGPGVDFALRWAQVVKLNDEELQRQSGRRVRTTGQIETAARRFAEKYRISRLCVTAGARGAGLLWDNHWNWEDAQAIEVRDTVGAGDAFLAGFIAAHFIRGNRPEQALARACRLGEFVASCEGAMPNYVLDRRARPTRSTRP